MKQEERNNNQTECGKPAHAAISVVIPLYNGAAYIERSIHSVLAQTVLPAEILVIDDGSTDNGAALVMQKNYPLVRLISQANAGVSAARNKGISESRYEYVAFLDADDQWTDNHLEIIAGLIKKYPRCGVFGTSYYFCRPGKKPFLPVLPDRFAFDGTDTILDNYFEMASGVNPPLHMSSYAVRKQSIEAFGGFPTGIPAGEDIITLARLHATCDIAYSKHPTSIYYLNPSEGKKIRPILWHNPIDQMFDELLRTAAHRKGVRRYVSSWHKGRMVGAFFAHHYRLAIREFFIAMRIFPFQKKLYYSAVGHSICLMYSSGSIRHQSVHPSKTKEMSRIAYIISAYKDAPHLSRLIKALDEDADFYVHIDRKADSRPFKELLPEGKVTFVQSHWVSWGGWEQVEYQKELLAAVLHSGIEYTRIVCLSGQDYPLWPNRKIHRYFEEHRDTEFIMGMNLTRSADKRQIAKIVYYHFFRDLKWENLWLKNKFIVASRHLMKWLPIRKAPIVRIGNKESDIYCGSDYWGITLPCAQYVYEKLCTEKELVRYFKTSFVPSELCIQTLVFNSPFAARALSVEGGYTGLSALTPLHYIIYGKSIKVLTLEDWSALQQSGKMFCRKVVSGASDSLVKTIETERKQEIS